MARYKLINGIKVQFTAEEEAQKDAEELAWTNNAFNRALESLRDKRNKLLADTDYLALSDQTLSAEMNTYRQQLRDLTNGLTTVEDVNNVVYPTKPQE
jgi:chromosome segregation ATPase